MYIQQLETFVKVAEEGSFSKAAKKLYISTSAVAQQINLLENRYQFNTCRAVFIHGWS